MSSATKNVAEEQIPFMQRLFENVWFLVAIGIVTPTILYTAWGLIDLLILPQFKP